MTDRRRVAIATFGRSDFSILRPLARLLVEDPAFDAGFWVGGAHFDDLSGRTVNDVEATGLPVWARIHGTPYDRSEIGTVQTMAAQMVGFAAAADDFELAGVDVETSGRPDLVLILGDRFEAVAAGLAMVPLGIPVGHISGGSITEGAIDDVFRHCLTKIAAVHFCDLPRFARRIHLMGEPTERVFTTGALGLDSLRMADPQPFGDLVRQFELSGLQPGYVLATLHPESGNPEVTAPMARAMVDGLLESGRQVVFTYPNADPGSAVIIDIIESVRDRPPIYCVPSFGADWYPAVMAHAGLMIGNSSGGIIEAASFGLPVVDIGDRQRGRERGPNVVHSDRDRGSVTVAIEVATDPLFIESARRGNLYGDGHGSDRVMAALRSLDWSSLGAPKVFADPDPSFVGEFMELA